MYLTAKHVDSQYHAQHKLPKIPSLQLIITIP